MLKKIGKACIVTVVTFFLTLAAWHFLLIKLPEDAMVLGAGSPTMPKEEVLNLMDYHGVKVVRAECGKWVFDRDGKTIPLTKRK